MENLDSRERGRPNGAAQPEAIPANLPRIGGAGVAVMFLLFVALLGGLFLLGYHPHRKRQAEAADAAEATRSFIPVVSVVLPKRQAKATEAVLPADVQAYQQTSIYPRANGYLKRLLVDIGDAVTAGQLLAEIDTPEIDAQLNQARAAVELSRANIEKAQLDHKLAESTLRRYENAAKSGSVAQQDFDEKRTQLEQAKASLNVARAALASAEAQVQQLETLQSFEKVNAPFDGVITARNYDVGALLSPSNTAAGRELLRIDRTDMLRVFANVPQAYASVIRPGQKVHLSVRNYPERLFEGSVTRTAGSIDSSTRTLRVQADFTNPDKLLYAGMYGQVTFHVDRPAPPLLVPTSALIYDASGLSLALLRDGKVHLQEVSVGHDLGTETEITEGLRGDEMVISNPGEQVREGAEVQPASIAPAAVTSRPAYLPADQSANASR